MKNQKKLKSLKDYLKSLESVAVAYSAGVDSTFLLECANDVLNKNVIAITVNSLFFQENELKEAKEFCKLKNIKHEIIDVDVLNNVEIVKNQPDRCYLCKKELFKNIIKRAEKFGIKNILEGSNADDSNDYRPGLRALKELKILSPLKDFGFTKNEIRELSCQFKKPSMACLATRIPYGEIITKEKLNMIQRAENYLKKLSFNQLRVRIHNDNIARIEVMEDEFEKVLKNKDIIVKEFNDIGFNYVSLDLKGYRSGSSNETLSL